MERKVVIRLELRVKSCKQRIYVWLGATALRQQQISYGTTSKRHKQIPAE